MDAIEHYKRRRKIAVIALGNKCAICGSANALEIDHVDPSTKSIELGRDWYNDNWWNEVLSLCQLLCIVHHREKTALELKARFQKDRNLLHGTSKSVSKIQV